MPFRYTRRKSIGKRWWVGLGRSGPSLGRRGKRASVSLNRHGLGGSVRLAKGLSYIFRRR